MPSVSPKPTEFFRLDRSIIVHIDALEDFPDDLLALRGEILPEAVDKGDVVDGSGTLLANEVLLEGLFLDLLDKHTEIFEGLDELRRMEACTMCQRGIGSSQGQIELAESIASVSVGQLQLDVSNDSDDLGVDSHTVERHAQIITCSYSRTNLISARHTWARHYFL